MHILLLGNDSSNFQNVNDFDAAFGFNDQASSYYVWKGPGWTDSGQGIRVYENTNQSVSMKYLHCEQGGCDNGNFTALENDRVSSSATED